MYRFIFIYIRIFFELVNLFTKSNSLDELFSFFFPLLLFLFFLWRCITFYLNAIATLNLLCYERIVEIVKSILLFRVVIIRAKSTTFYPVSIQLSFRIFTCKQFELDFIFFYPLLISYLLFVFTLQIIISIFYCALTIMT